MRLPINAGYFSPCYKTYMIYEHGFQFDNVVDQWPRYLVIYSVVRAGNWLLRRYTIPCTAQTVTPVVGLLVEEASKLGLQQNASKCEIIVDDQCHQNHEDLRRLQRNAAERTRAIWVANSHSKAIDVASNSENAQKSHLQISAVTVSRRTFSAKKPH